MKEKNFILLNILRALLLGRTSAKNHNFWVPKKSLLLAPPALFTNHGDGSHRYLFQTYTCLHVCVLVNNQPCCSPTVSLIFVRYLSRGDTHAWFIVAFTWYIPLLCEPRGELRNYIKRAFDPTRKSPSQQNALCSLVFVINAPLSNKHLHEMTHSLCTVGVHHWSTDMVANASSLMCIFKTGL